ncbi:hypothetical protein [Puniceicoccus vermicola]|uniref:Uncharacterized protein n=1 Tax=Puniceicoccus vermicola TaxID=388746 RepID=A0A7X1AYY7_9BACT|nr:hypothetical protein [Puniceicoccus vermicola]MBC2602492.1 hypothetical protein [Puniceicoccus vermicola]
MDNLLEILLPLVFFAIYFVSQFLGKKSEDEQDPGKEPSDDLRKIREELRRKIQERRQGSPQEYQREEKPPEASRPEAERGGAVLRESQPHRGMVERRSSSSRNRESASEPALATTSNIERDLEVQMEEVRRSQEKADSARRQARQRVAFINQAAAKARSQKSATSYRQFLREALDDPQNLQKSFILHEVFGTPVGMRRDGQMRPSWDL